MLDTAGCRLAVAGAGAGWGVMCMENPGSGDQQEVRSPTSECSVIDEKLSSSIVKLAGRNEIPETF